MLNWDTPVNVIVGLTSPSITKTGCSTKWFFPPSLSHLTHSLVCTGRNSYSLQVRSQKTINSFLFDSITAVMNVAKPCSWARYFSKVRSSFACVLSLPRQAACRRPRQALLEGMIFCIRRKASFSVCRITLEIFCLRNWKGVYRLSVLKVIVKYFFLQLPFFIHSVQFSDCKQCRMWSLFVVFLYFL